MSWVRFGDFSLKKLLLGVEDYDKISRREDWAFGLEEEGRFSLSRCSNKARTYLLCSVRDADGKRFSLVVLEGRGFDKWVASAYREVSSFGLGC